MSSVDTESILSTSSFSSSINNTVSEVASKNMLYNVKSFVKSFKFKLILLLLLLVGLSYLKNNLKKKLNKQLSVEEKLQDKSVEPVNNTEENITNDDDYKIVIDEQGNPVLLSMNDIKNLEKKLQKKSDQLGGNTRHLETIDEEIEQPEQPEQPQQPQQPQQQQVTVETMNNLLLEESDIEEDLNVNEQNLTNDEINAIDNQLKNI